MHAFFSSIVLRLELFFFSRSDASDLFDEDPSVKSIKENKGELFHLAIWSIFFIILQDL